MTRSALLDALRGAVVLARDAPVGEWPTSSDALLSELLGVAAALKKTAERHVAVAAREVSRRSAPELGPAGFAQRAGHRTVEEFLKAETGVTGRDAATTVRVGTLDGALGEALRDGRVSVPAVAAIRAGLGEPTGGMSAELLDRAAERLCEEGVTLDPDRLQRRAREVRDELDETGVADRERARRAARSLRLVTQADGMTRIAWLLDPESAAIVTTIYDRATSPRRGGPRFADPAVRERVRRVMDDERTTEQLASDAFTELLRQSASVDREVLVGGDEPAVRIVIAAPAAYGVLERGEAVGVTTVQRAACAGGTLPVVIDRTGQVLDVGRAHRLFTRVQRRVLAVRDGGCMWPGCDRPPSWTEAHHIRSWSEGGGTDLANGILLCRHHHLRLHDEHWRIVRRSGRYRLEPPPGSGRAGALLATRSRAVREALAG